MRIALVGRFLVVACIVTVGCSKDQLGGRLPMTGTVTDAGAPLEVEGREMGLGMVTIGFCRVENENDPDRVEVASSLVEADGSFELVDGIDPGLYVITIKQWDPYPQTDRLKGRFSETNSKIFREISDNSALTIDVSKPDG